ncbi:MAG: hypothetical protein ACOH13_06155 [Flavobacteriales bacterium]
MKNKQMNNQKRNSRWSWSLTAVALLGLMGNIHGQAEPLCNLTTDPVLIDLKVDTPVLDAISSGHLPVRITDDGRQEYEPVATTQLIFAFENGHDRSLTVDVFDDRGYNVARRILTPKSGRSALAMDVKALCKGRYVARIMEGETARVVRFQR